MRKSELKFWINDKTFHTMSLLTELYTSRNSLDRHLRRLSVWEAFHEIKLLGCRNKVPSARFIYTWSWKYNKDYLEDAIIWATSHEQISMHSDKINKRELYCIVSEYFRWLSQQLAKHRIVHIESVMNELDELGLTE